MCVYARELLSFILYVAWVKIRIKEMEITKFGNNGLVCLPLRENLFVSALSQRRSITRMPWKISLVYFTRAACVICEYIK